MIKGTSSGSGSNTNDPLASLAVENPTPARRRAAARIAARDAAPQNSQLSTRISGNPSTPQGSVAGDVSSSARSEAHRGTADSSLNDEASNPEAGSVVDAGAARRATNRMTAVRESLQNTPSVFANALQNAPSAFANAATRDLTETMTTRHDHTTLRRLNSQDGIQVGAGVNVSFQGMQADLDEVKGALNVIKLDNPKLHARFEGYIDKAQRSLSSFDQNRNTPTTTAKAAVALAANSAFLALPWLLATDPMKVKDVGPDESRLSKQFMIVMAGYQAKTVALMASHSTSPVSNSNTLASFIKERHAYDTQGFLTGAAATFSKTVYDKVDGNPAYTLGRAATSAIALNALFQNDKIGSIANYVGTGLRSLATTGTMRNATSTPRLEAQSEHLNPMQRNTLENISYKLDGLQGKLAELDAHLHENDTTPSVTWSDHVTQAMQSLEVATSELRIASRTESPPSSNPAQNQKLMLAAVGAMVYAANTLLVLDDGLAVADVLGDAAFSIPILLANAFDPSVTEKGAKDSFKSFVGTSLISAAVFGVNAFAQDPIGNNDKVFYAMLPIFAGLALTMPSPTADAMVSVLEKMTACFPGTNSGDISEDGDMELASMAGVRSGVMGMGFDADDIPDMTDFAIEAATGEPAADDAGATARREFVAQGADTIQRVLNQATAAEAGEIARLVGDGFLQLLERGARQDEARVDGALTATSEEALEEEKVEIESLDQDDQDRRQREAGLRYDI